MFSFKGKELLRVRRTSYLCALETPFRRMSSIAPSHLSLFLTWCSRVWATGRAAPEVSVSPSPASSLEGPGRQPSPPTALLLVGSHARKHPLPLPPPDHAIPFPSVLQKQTSSCVLPAALPDFADFGKYWATLRTGRCRRGAEAAARPSPRLRRSDAYARAWGRERGPQTERAEVPEAGGEEQPLVPSGGCREQGGTDARRCAASPQGLKGRRAAGSEAVSHTTRQ